jgi:uroporphyrinogen III methyltransferase / synthase
MIATVHLLGVGPGDPRLLTLRSAELLATADLVVHQGNIAEGILERASGRVEQIRRGDPAALLVEWARQHSRIVRLFPGDPFLFGDAAAEAAALRGAGVPFEIVPGVMLPVAASNCAGIPAAGLHRDRPVVTLSAAGLASTSGEALALFLRSGGTLLGEVNGEEAMAMVQHLVAAGIPRDLPAALVESAACATQQTRVVALGWLAEELRQAPASGPAALVIGEAVRARDRLAWFEQRPLFGRTIIVTRPRAQAGGFSLALENLGANVLTMPTIRIEDPTDPEPLRRVAAEPDRFDWIVFTSVNGVERFWGALRAGGLDTRSLGGVSICAIGPATAAAVELEGAGVDLLPREYVAESVVAALREEGDLQGTQILLPRAEVAREILPRALGDLGAVVTEVAAYRTRPDLSAAERLRETLRAGAVSMVTFTSSSTVRNFVDLVGVESLGGVRVASIGPITSATARDLGLTVDVQAEQHTTEGLLEAIRAHFGGQSAS